MCVAKERSEPGRDMVVPCTAMEEARQGGGTAMLCPSHAALPSWKAASALRLLETPRRRPSSFVYHWPFIFASHAAHTGRVALPLGGSWTGPCSHYTGRRNRLHYSHSTCGPGHVIRDTHPMGPMPRHHNPPTPAGAGGNKVRCREALAI